MVIIEKIAEISGLPSLAIEAGFLLLLTFLFVIAVFLVLAIFRIKNELIKISYIANYIARFLERGYKNRKLHKVNYDIKTEHVVLKMLQQGKTYGEIKKSINVSEEYVDLIKGLAKEKGLLPQKAD